MSTTDTRAAFEAWAIKENYAFYSESERCLLFYGVSGTRNAIQKAWEAGMAQAATEAAKATGTAGELPPMVDAWYHGITEKHFEHAMYAYGQQCAEAARQSLMQLFLDPENQPTQYGTVLAARQPAPSRDEIEGAFAIKVEKMLCEALGRQWSAVGISVEGLISELKSQQPAPVVIPQWHDRTNMYSSPQQCMQAMKEEIADLRAALAARSQP